MYTIQILRLIFAALLRRGQLLLLEFALGVAWMIVVFTALALLFIVAIKLTTYAWQQPAAVYAQALAGAAGWAMAMAFYVANSPLAAAAANRA